jgi:formylglycine-generating enzyme required for sulfatase activity
MMAAAFDPYHKWLGIPPEDQPPNHYRLLAIKIFEDDAEVIEHAADRQMAHLRSFHAGRYGQLSQKLLNEVAAARLCLLKAENKAAYDAQLRRLLDAAKAGQNTSSHGQFLRELGKMAAGDRYRVAQPARENPRGVIVAGWVALLLLGMGAAGWWVAGRYPKAQTDPQQPLVANPPAMEPPVCANQSKPPKSPAVELVSIRQPQPARVEKPSPKPAAAPPAPIPKPIRPSRKPPFETPQPPRIASTPSSPSFRTAIPQEVARLPLPSQAAQDQAMKTARDIYKADYDRAKTPAEKQALARKLLEQATSSELQGAERFVVLGLARDVAARGDDLELAFEAINRMAAAYDIEPLAMKAETLAMIAKAAKGQSGHKAIAEQAADLAGEALNEDKFDTAAELAKLAQVEAAKARDKEAVLKARNLSKDIQEVQKAFIAVKAALASIKQNRDDTEANLAVGRYFALVKGDWGRGLPYLAKGSDSELKALVGLELGGLADRPDFRMKIADGWWDHGQKEPPAARDQVVLHAASLYLEANVEGETARARIEKRLAAAAAIRRRRPPPPLAVAPFNATRARELQRQWAIYSGLPLTTVNTIGMKLVLVPPGEFFMGTTAEEAEVVIREVGVRGYEDFAASRVRCERPQHPVRIQRPFYLGMYEVEQEQYESVMGQNPSAFSSRGSQRDRVEGVDCRHHPVDNVSWEDAVSFCARLSARAGERVNGRRYRLPTEAEWEYACRAGTTGLWHCHDESALKAEAWFSGQSQEASHAVGQKTPNAWLLYDMLGNLWEWCTDGFTESYYERSPLADPAGPSNEPRHVVRGGSWLDASLLCRPAFRNSGGPNLHRSSNGFRIAGVVTTD